MGKGLAVLSLVGALVASKPSGVLAQQMVEPRDYILATATTGGTYYPVGVALATLTKVKLQPFQGISLTAITSAGSAENVVLMREKEAQFAILQGLYGAYAWQGSGPLEDEGPQGWMRSITMLWENVEHFGVRTSLATTGTIEDMANLEGRRFAIGARNSGTEGSGLEILRNLGFAPERDFRLAYLEYTPSVSAMTEGSVDGFNIPAGPPVGAVTQAFTTMGRGVTLLDFTPEQVARANGGRDLWRPYVIPAGTYPNQSKEVRTIAQPNVLVVRADIPEEAVYLITKTIFENLPFLHGIHAATQAMSLEGAISGLPTPLHPGAYRYFMDRGLTIPDRLKP